MNFVDLTEYAWMLALLGLAISGAIYGYVKKQDPGNEMMVDLGEQIHDGAMAFLRREYTVLAGAIGRAGRSNPLEQGIGEGENPVPWPVASARCAFVESGCLGLQLEVGGKFHLKLNTGGRPIANKYREGKMQRTLKRELKSA